LNVPQRVRLRSSLVAALLDELFEQPAGLNSSSLAIGVERDDPVSPLCSRNARPRKGLVGRAQWETRRAILETYMSKLGRTI
ncbi:MAG: hypothetical protein AAB433_18590, partial [Nitrospirota bacterium]